MDPDPHRSEDADLALQAIAKTAAEWKARHDDGLTADEEKALACWLKEDDRNAELFGEMDATWALLDRARELSPSDIGIPLHSERRAARQRRRALCGAIFLAAAAAVAIVFGGFHRSNSAADRFQESVVVDAGLVRRLNLPDGSIVRLNGDSHVSVDFDARVRRVQLVRGQAHFEVAKAVHRPFVVTAGGVDVSAVGTAFEVVVRSVGVEVLVTEGRVRVADRANGVSLLPVTGEAAAGVDRLLVAGEQAVIPMSSTSAPASATVQALSSDHLEQRASWRHRRLEFDSATLAEIAAQFNRYNRQQLVIADPSLAELRFSGSFQSDEPETLVALLRTRMTISVVEGPGETVLRATPSSPPAP